MREGCHVTIITGFPNFPEGKIFKGYKNIWYQKDYMEGIEVRRVKTYITANEGFAKRTLDYISYMITGFVAGLFVKKPDVIVATSPQFFTACAGWMLSVFKRKPFVFELRDIWPASIKAVGAVKNELMLGFLERLEIFLYRRAALIISVTQSFKDDLGARGIPNDKIVVILNGVDQSAFKARQKDAVLVEKYKLANKFVAGYVGTVGMAHSVETIVDAAEILQKDDDYFFLIVGGGAQFKSIKEKIADKKLRNILILDRQEKSLIPNILSLCDVSLVHLKNSKLFSKVIPSKVFESFAMGLPIILGLPAGEASQIVNKTGAGLTIAPESPRDMVEAICRIREDNELRTRLRNNALAAAAENSRDERALQMLEELKKVASE